jgi:hypothetical protein
MLANDGAGLDLDRGTPVSVHLPCEALRVLRTEAKGLNEDESGGSSVVPARAPAT